MGISRHKASIAKACKMKMPVAAPGKQNGSVPKRSQGSVKNRGSAIQNTVSEKKKFRKAKSIQAINGTAKSKILVNKSVHSKNNLQILK